MSMTVNVGQAFLSNAIERSCGLGRQGDRHPMHLEGSFQVRAPAEAIDQQAQSFGKTCVLQGKWLAEIRNCANLTVRLAQQLLHFVQELSRLWIIEIMSETPEDESDAGQKLRRRVVKFARHALALSTLNLDS